MTVKPEVPLLFDSYLDEQLGLLPEYISSSYEKSLKYQREYDKKRRENETSEQREIRLEKKREYEKRKRENETCEQREKRLKYHRERRLKYHREWAKKKYDSDPEHRKSNSFKSIKI